MSERGREPFVATGRGGAGNMMRSPSRGRDIEVREESGRQAAVAAAAPHVTHAGRGGAGNVRSPSRDPVERKKIEQAQREEALLQQKAQASEANHPHTTGRGGAGNIKSSSSGSISRDNSSRDHSEDRGRGRNGDGGNRGGPVGNVLRSLSRSRSRDARGTDDSPSRGASSGATLPQVDETASTNGSTTTASTATENGKSSSFASKIAAHLPGHHKS